MHPEPPLEWHRGEFMISTDRGRLDLRRIHAFLTTSYWATGVTIETVHRSVEHSLAFGVFAATAFAGFGRVITDQATFAYVSDVFVLPEYRRRGLGKWLLEVMVSHPSLESVRCWRLKTRDAHGLYRAFGFGALPDPDMHMQFTPRIAARE